MTRKLLFAHQGENSTTRHTPVAEVLSQAFDKVTAEWPSGEQRTVSLLEDKQVCINSGWDALITIKLYEVGEVDMPAWMPACEYIQNQVAWKYYVGFGASFEWPRQWFQRLSRMGEAAKYAAIQLLKVKNFRSTFRASLREQLEAWLNDNFPAHESPFSERQWSCLINGRIALDAKRRAQSLYWNR